jgi:hypothetical protein
MKPKVYIETTIVGYLASSASTDVVTAARQRITRDWWQHRRNAFELYCSDVVNDEAGEGDENEARKRLSILAGLTILRASPKAEALTNALLKKKAIPAKAKNDAAHVAIAAVGGMDYLLTWNFRHLANASLRGFIESICKRARCKCPTICTPEELLAE